MLCNLGDYYYSTLELLHYLPDLDNAIRADEKAEAIAMETPDDPVGELHFHRLRLYRCQTERCGTRVSKQAVVACPPRYSLNSSILGGPPFQPLRQQTKPATGTRKFRQIHQSGQNGDRDNRCRLVRSNSRVDQAG